MILYDPTSGNPVTTPVAFRPRTSFFMSKMGPDAPPFVKEVRARLASLLREVDYDLIDAGGVTTGRDYLRKIWEVIVSVPMGMAVVYRNMPAPTLGNVFYELGLMQATGKNTLVITERGTKMPSDFVRTEHVVYGPGFDEKIRAFMRSALAEAEYLTVLAEQAERNPMLAIDCYRRAFLLTGDEEYCRRTDELLASGIIGERAKNCVEFLTAGFRDFARGLGSGRAARQVAATEAAEPTRKRGGCR